jgi:enoyl-CoA hydratase
MTEPVLLVDRSGEVATLTLNRPRAMNALSRALRQAIAEAFVELAADAATRVVILTGAGRAFCAGLDLKELSSSGTDATATFGGKDMIEAIAAFEGPVIGAINGFAITGGFELALACDLLIASREARFADTHARVGILPGWGLSQKLPRLIGIHRAKELAFTGNYLAAERAEAWGLVNRVVAPEELLPTCRALAADMLGCVPEALRGYKRVIDAGFATTFSEGMAMEGRASRDHARSVTPELLAQRRGRVQERGRSQTRR